MSMVITCIGVGFASIFSGMILKLGDLKSDGFIANTAFWYIINNYF